MLKGIKREWPAFGIVAVFIITLFFLVSGDQDRGASPEISRILSLKSTSEQSNELLKLLKRVGPLEGQEQLLKSGLPFTGQTHLLVHTVGNFIYDEFGPQGLSYCKDYFLSACYHAVILNTLGDNGISGVVEAMALCDKAGGKIVSSQCAHGAGHGFVAWHDYDLVKALKMCDELGTKAKDFQYFNCYDGAFMENVWGVHNGVPSEKRWIKEDDIYYPCTDPRIPEKYLGGCWSNQATLIFQHFKGDLKKTAMACDAVENSEYQKICYDNFSRQIHPLTQGSIEKVKGFCSSATGSEWQNSCIITNMGAYWSVGDRELPFRLCESLVGEVREQCFSRLSNQINVYYEGNLQEKQKYCDKIRDTNFRKACQN